MNPFSRYRAKHTAECRDRIEKAMMATSEDQTRVIRAMERNNLAKTSREDKDEEEEEHKRRREEAGESGAAGSGLTDKERKESKAEEARKSDDPMETEATQAPGSSEPSEELEEAPRSKPDVRVPMAARKPAQKREIEKPETDEDPGGKWQMFEATDRKRERERMTP